MSSPARIGMVGLGRFGVGFHLRRLLDMEDTVVVAGLCDRSPERLRDGCERLGAASDRLTDCFTCTDVDELIDPHRVDGIIVSTNNTNHRAPCELALERGVPVMVDKPPSVTAADTEALVRLSHERDVPFLVAFTRHFFPAVERVREQIQSGAVGEVPAIYAVQCGCPQNDRPEDGGFLHQRNVHIFDLIPWLVGSPVAQVEAQLRFAGPWETFADMRLLLASGTEARFLSLSDTEQNQDEVTIHATGAGFRIQRQELFNLQPRGPWEAVTDLPADQADSTSHFVDVVRGCVPAGREYAERHGEDGLRAMRVLEGVVESGRTGKPVELPA